MANEVIKNETNKIEIKKFVEDYNNIATEALKDKYLRNNLIIKSYLPYVDKVNKARMIANASVYEYKEVTLEDGTTTTVRTNEINVKSHIRYLLFCRSIIEEYTNLQVKTVGFYEEYDLLKSSGILDKLIVGTENNSSIVPENEINEFKVFCEMAFDDVMQNIASPQVVANTTVVKFVDVITKAVNQSIDSISSVDPNALKQLSSTISNGFKRVK